MDKEPITFGGLEKLKRELDHLKNIKRPNIIIAIAEARSHGDLKDNAEYHAAKEQQSLLERRIVEINDTIARANVIDVSKIDYIKVLDINKIIKPYKKLSNYKIFIAYYFNSIRLIDNI